MHLFGGEKGEKKQFCWLINSFQPIGSSHASLSPDEMGRDATSASVTSVAFWEFSTPVFKIVAGHSGHIGTTAGWDGKRGGEAGRIAPTQHPHARTDAEPCHFSLSPPSSYITFSNSCMDLIMVSSCREMRGAIGAENNGIKHHSTVKFGSAAWSCVVGVKASWRQQFSKVDSSDKGQYLPPGRLEQTPLKSPLHLCFYPFSEKEQRIVIKSEDVFQTEALFLFVLYWFASQWGTNLKKGVHMLLRDVSR